MDGENNLYSYIFGAIVLNDSFFFRRKIHVNMVATVYYIESVNVIKTRKIAKF